VGRLLLLVPSYEGCLNIEEFQQQDDIIIMIDIYKSETFS
jgi:hypothetical protein